MANLDFSRLWLNIQNRLDGGYPGWRQTIDGYGQVRAIKKRRSDHVWTDAEIFEGIVFSILSKNTDWSKIERIRSEIGNMFFDFDFTNYAKLGDSDIDKINNRFLEYKAGSMTLKKDLKWLRGSAKILLFQKTKYGSIDNYFTNVIEKSGQSPRRAAVKLGTEARFKLLGMQVPLAAEALRNIGYDLSKPDRHMLRAVGSFGLMEFRNWADRSASKAPQANSQEMSKAMDEMQNFARHVNQYTTFVDNAVWLLCARSGLNLSNQELLALVG